MVKVRVGILGATGRMGRELIAAAATRSDLVVSAAVDHPHSSLLQQDSGVLACGQANGVQVSADLTEAFEKIDVLIDFTQSQVTLSALQQCVKSGVAVVIGTTGFTEEEKQQITNAAQSVPIVFAPNMSPGVNLMFKLVELAAQALYQETDIEILESHHKHKVDAPSGTALQLGELVAQAAGKPLSELATLSREGQTGEREKGTIGFATVRAGDIVGEHTVLFAGSGERLEITHKADHRKHFAQGALRAAAWLSEKPPGLYTMQQVLDL